MGQMEDETTVERACNNLCNSPELDCNYRLLVLVNSTSHAHETFDELTCNAYYVHSLIIISSEKKNTARRE